jgi:hypothetical protein
MTKQEMIHEIQVAEARAWKELGEIKDAFGTDAEQTARARSAWHALYALRESIGVEGLPALELLRLQLLPVRESQTA